MSINSYKREKYIDPDLSCNLVAATSEGHIRAHQGLLSNRNDRRHRCHGLLRAFDCEPTLMPFMGITFFCRFDPRSQETGLGETQ